ncbi:MAG: hypothetical protein R2856_29295 [Caldilineaceae bacterium]
MLGGAAVPVGSAIFLHTLLQFPNPRPGCAVIAVSHCGCTRMVALAALYVVSTLLPAWRLLHLDLPATNFPLIDTLLYGAGIACLLWSAATALRSYRRLRLRSASGQALVARPRRRWGRLSADDPDLLVHPDCAGGLPLLPLEILLAFGVVLPLGIVYALKNAELVRNLQQEIAQSRFYSRQIDALWVRERTLHQLADRLHDEVLADLRGGRMVLESWQSGNTPPAVRAQQLNFLVDALGTLYRRVRDVVTRPSQWIGARE